MQDINNINLFCQQTATQHSISCRKILFNRGINDAWYMVSNVINGKTILCPYYITWKSMLRRCYSKLFHKTRPTYKNCIVCDEWLLFSNFRQWMETQDWEGKNLDKDIIVPGNKIYSPETCIFVPSQINNLLVDCGSHRGEFPTGVSWDKYSNKFRAECSVKGKRKKLGRFYTVEEAEETYKRFKSSLIFDIASEQTDMRVKQGLILHANILMEGL